MSETTKMKAAAMQAFDDWLTCDDVERRQSLDLFGQILDHRLALVASPRSDAGAGPPAPLETLTAEEAELVAVYRQNRCGDVNCEGARFSMAQAVLNGAKTHIDCAQALFAWKQAQSEVEPPVVPPSAGKTPATPAELSDAMVTEMWDIGVAAWSTAFDDKPEKSMKEVASARAEAVRTYLREKGLLR